MPFGALLIPTRADVPQIPSNPLGLLVESSLNAFDLFRCQQLVPKLMQANPVPTHVRKNGQPCL